MCYLLKEQITTLEITLTPEQHKLATDYQDSYEKLFRKRLSLEDSFKISMLFINMIWRINHV